MTTHAVIFLNHPPAVLNILSPPILRIVEQRSRYVRPFRADATQEKRGQSRAPLLSQIGLGHTELVFALQVWRLTGGVNLRLRQLVFEEAALSIPVLLFLAVGNLQRYAAILVILRHQSRAARSQ